MSVKFAFSRPTQTDEERDLLFREYHSTGYAGLQLKHAQYAPYINDSERFLDEWGTWPGIASALITGGPVDDEIRSRLASLLNFSESVGTETIVFCHGLSREHVTAEDIRRFARQLSELGKECEQRGVQLSLHHHYDQPVMYREDFDIFFDQLQDRTVGLTMDTAHLVKSGISDVAEIITSFAPYIDNFHMKDFAGGDWRVLGEGDINFVPIFQAIHEIGYVGWMSADEESGGGIQEGMHQCLHFMQQGIQEAQGKSSRR